MPQIVPDDPDPYTGPSLECESCGRGYDPETDADLEYLYDMGCVWCGETGPFVPVTETGDA